MVKVVTSKKVLKDYSHNESAFEGDTIELKFASLEDGGVQRLSGTLISIASDYITVDVYSRKTLVPKRIYLDTILEMKVVKN